MDIYTQFLGFFDQHADQIGVKGLEAPITPYQQTDLDPSPDSQMSKLKSDISSTNHDHALRQPLQVEKSTTLGDVFLPGYIQIIRSCPGADQDMLCPDLPGINFNCLGCHKSSLTSKDIDRSVGQILLNFLRYRVGEAVLETVKLLPVKLGVAF